MRFASLSDPLFIQDRRFIQPYGWWCFLSSTTALFGDLVSHWVFFPANHQLLASMVSVVGENSSTLVILGLAFMVFGFMLG
ncbi:hypothetical protein EP47_01940 [Legionella norrlandica]|uniref:Uncharacterized protein n=1 Tax=Legionella norrlandica TaxID=1498499 RepID=A0A0A2T406_9GAMM|nr:hypothetical protein EP47_01940 [Legionella norrlandica]